MLKPAESPASVSLDVTTPTDVPGAEFSGNENVAGFITGVSLDPVKLMVTACGPFDASPSLTVTW